MECIFALPFIVGLRIGKTLKSQTHPKGEKHLKRGSIVYPFGGMF
jgi:hypothetical protein